MNDDFIVRSAVLEYVCGVKSKIPTTKLPEYAFAGRSNVGKSTLINAILGRRAFARTSSEPGKTQTINFYKVNNEFYLVDLPGYGYTKSSLSIKAEWGKMVERYLLNSSKLRKVFLLLDIRRRVSCDDALMYNWTISSLKEPVLVVTKCDKLKKNERLKSIKLIAETFGKEQDSVIMFSSVNKSGLDLVYKAIST